MRRGAALLAVALLAVTAGCTGAFSGSLTDEQLGEEPAEPYQWDADTDVYIVVSPDATFRVVYDIPTNRSEMRLYRRDGFGGTNPIPVSAVRYQYPNGTVINGTEFAAYGGSIERTSDAVVVEFPHAGQNVTVDRADRNGTANESDSDGPVNATDRNATANATAKFAFTSEGTPKRFTLPTFREGSHELVLPPNRSVDFFLFGNVIPREDEKTEIDHRTHLRWDNVTASTIVVQYYLERDLYIFGGLFGLFAVAAMLGVVYYRRQIERLRERREAVDVDTDDESRKGPPPGMG